MHELGDVMVCTFLFFFCLRSEQQNKLGSSRQRPLRSAFWQAKAACMLHPAWVSAWKRCRLAT